MSSSRFPEFQWEALSESDGGAIFDHVPSVRLKVLWSLKLSYTTKDFMIKKKYNV